jgi:hypothetical protein
MRLSRHLTHRRLAAAAAALVCCAGLAPAASAMIPDPGPAGSAIVQPPARTPPEADVAGTIARPAPAYGIEAQHAPAGTIASPIAAEPGFDWADAGTGIALGALAGTLLGAALVMGRGRVTPRGA